MSPSTAINRLSWLPRLVTALTIGVLAMRLTGGFFANLHLSLNAFFGWEPESAPMFAYALILKFLLSSVGAFIAATIFRRWELGVALLVFLIDATLFDPLLQLVFGDLDGAENYLEALERGHLTPPELAVGLIGDGLLNTLVAAMFAHMLRKYREARELGPFAASMPPRWAFELGGGLLCAAAVLLPALLFGVGVMEYALISGIEDRSWYQSPGLLFTINVLAATFFARAYPLGRRVMQVNRSLPDDGFEILFLRSFSDDLIDCRPDYTAIPYIGFVANAFDGRTLEDAVTSLLRRHGRVLALGDPDEMVGGGFTARLHLPREGDAWRAVVERSLREARLVAIIPNDAAGIVWEMAQVRNLGLMRKAIVILPPVAVDGVAETEENRTRRWGSLAAIGLVGDPPEGKSAIVVTWNESGAAVRRTADAPSFKSFRKLVGDLIGQKALELGLDVRREERVVADESRRPNPQGFGIVLGFSGRINRLAFAAALIAVIVASQLIQFVISALFARVPESVGWAWLLAGYWAIAHALLEFIAQLSLLIRRTHDIGRPAWQALAALAAALPILSVVDLLIAGQPGTHTISNVALAALVVTLALWPGQEGPNRFGPDTSARSDAKAQRLYDDRRSGHDADD